MLLHSQHRFRCHNSNCSLSPLNLWRLPAVVIEFRTCSRCRWGVLHRIDYCTCRHRRLYCFDCISKGITKIVFSRSTRRWKPRSHWSLHAPSRAAQRFYISTSCAPRTSTVQETSSCVATHRLHSSRASTHQNVTYWHHRPRQLTSSLTSCWPELTLSVDFD